MVGSLVVGRDVVAASDGVGGAKVYAIDPTPVSLPAYPAQGSRLDPRSGDCLVNIDYGATAYAVQELTNLSSQFTPPFVLR